MRIGRDRRPGPAGRRRARSATLKRASGRRTLRLGFERRPGARWLADLPGVRGRCDPAPDDVELELLPGSSPTTILAAAIGRGLRSRASRSPSRSLEALFIEHVGRPAGDETTLGLPTSVRRSSQSAAADPSRAEPAPGIGPMSRRDPLLPNAGIVARREYRDRVRSPLFLVSTVVLWP